MKIADYSIQSMSAHKLDKNTEVTENIKMWAGSNEEIENKEEPSFALEIGNNEASSFMPEKTYLKSPIDNESFLEQEARIKLKLIELFIYQVTGKQVELETPKITLCTDSIEMNLPGDPKNDNGGELGWGITYDYREVIEEHEEVLFRSGGMVKTKDGKEFEFELDFKMSRSFYQEKNVNIRMGDAAKVDPLVVVFDEGAPKLTRERQGFDLNGDGKEEEIAMPTQGSGFLALDKNEDGRINDGTELFGPENGDGFAALRIYDMDNNGWIDEQDEVFGKLSILAVGKFGKRVMFRLGEAGIGAIYLGKVDTKFDIKDGDDEQGTLRSSSIFVRENGTVGTLHHIDLST